jgi:mono/diheme cytochrome c family protein
VIIPKVNRTLAGGYEMHRIVGLSFLCCTLVASVAAAAEAPKATPALLEKGKASFERNCAACHGPTGAGDGVAAAALNPKPRNLATEKFENGAKPAQIFATLAKGIPGTAMVGFVHLPEDERWALAHYVASMRKEAGPKGKKR